MLPDAMFEYYLDENAYFVEKEGGLRGSIPARDMKVTTATKSGHDKTRDGYHFTIENTSNGKLVDCACEDAEGREMWLQTIQACIEASDAITGYPMPPDSEAQAEDSQQLVLDFIYTTDLKECEVREDWEALTDAAFTRAHKRLRNGEMQALYGHSYFEMPKQNS